MQTFLLALLTSTSVANLIIFFVNRHDAKKKDPYTALEKKIDENEAAHKERAERIERDLCRLQMLNLMDHRPDDTTELMTVAERYFCELKGDWYMDGLFSAFCESHGIALPSWFNK